MTANRGQIGTDGDAPIGDVAEDSELRRYLLGVGYRLLGCVQDAEDAVQEAFVRWQQEEQSTIRDPRGWLTTVVARIALDQLRSARRRREEYVGPWLPEPIVGDDACDPANEVVLRESVHTAMLVVLESLSPAERVVFVLREVFGIHYDRIAAAVDRSQATCRQLYARSCRYVRRNTPRFELDRSYQQAVVTEFRRACGGGDLTSLVRVLDPEVMVRSDGGGVVTAARRPIVGVDRVATYLLRVLRKWPITLRPATVNEAAGLVAECDGRIAGVISLTVREGRICGVDAVLNPEKLRLVPGAGTTPATPSARFSPVPRHSAEAVEPLLPPRAAGHDRR